jgi:hypothetical protein
VLKDINSGNAGTITKSFRVPRLPDDKLQLSSLILADKVETLPPTEIGTGPFRLGSNRVLPNVKNEFTEERNKSVELWFQVYSLKLDESSHKPNATFEMLITRNGQEVKRTVEEVSELSNAASQMTLARSIPLSDLEPGQYALQVKVTDNLSKDVIAASEKFTVR